MENSTPKAVFVCEDNKIQCKLRESQPPEFGHFFFGIEQRPQ